MIDIVNKEANFSLVIKLISVKTYLSSIFKALEKIFHLAINESKDLPVKNPNPSISVAKKLKSRSTSKVTAEKSRSSKFPYVKSTESSDFNAVNVSRIKSKTENFSL